MNNPVVANIPIMDALTSGGLVTLIGIGVVFVALLCLVGITILMSKAIKSFIKEEPVKAQVNVAPVAPIVNQDELVAAIASAIAIGMGTEPSALSIQYIKRV